MDCSICTQSEGNLIHELGGFVFVSPALKMK
jgi:hypothetical protein